MQHDKIRWLTWGIGVTLDKTSRSFRNGSLTFPNIVIILRPKGITWDEWVRQKKLIVQKTKRKEVVPEGQMGLEI
mgnify:CR=1 FL=1